MVSFRFSLTPDDFVNYSAYVHLDAPGKKKALFKRSWPVIIVLLFIVSVNIIEAISSGKFDSSIFIIILVFAFLFFGRAFALRPLLKKQAIQFAANSSNASFFSMTDYTFSETGVVTRDDVKEVKFQWTAFIKKVETAGYFYLFIHSTSALIIPKRIFRSQVEKEKFEQLLSQYVSFDAELGHLVKQ